ncbi:MAG TPA: phenylalanine--tRNA ligase subunit beta, partial [Puia sp.]|nr:phenylalanine--tRNA ligase subunit beta [Puia sp.]
VDHLKLTLVNAGGGQPLSIVCGARNVEAGQKVVVALPGTTIYPATGDPVTLKVATIRGVESQGMICAEDEIGLGSSHDGILVLPPDAPPGTAAADWFKPFSDLVFGIGLTPNHMDAMSHLGVARDVCAWLTHHENGEFRPRQPLVDAFRVGPARLQVEVRILNSRSCQRYSGVSIRGIRVGESPRWMRNRLQSIGIRSINNIVDVTNFVLHEMGQPLHAFDWDRIRGHKIIVRNLPEGTPFVTLDEKERKLAADDLMVCDEGGGIAMAGVFGGLHSGITASTENIFLESAWFNPTDIRRTSFRHGLRTDAAVHFEKGMDISGTVHALKRAALLITELAGGEIASEIVDAYPEPQRRPLITLQNEYLKKLSGKEYGRDTTKKILVSLGFEVAAETADSLELAVPWNKPDVRLPADVVEEVMRIDGLDNVPIPSALTISPSVENDPAFAAWKLETSSWLVAQGFNEILTNSITNSAYFNEAELASGVKMINNLSADLDIMRPSMLETGLESVAYNLNRKCGGIRFFEFGKTYRSLGVGRYEETNHLCLYVTGQLAESNWKGKGGPADIFYLKGLCEKIFAVVGLAFPGWMAWQDPKFLAALAVRSGDAIVAAAGEVDPAILKRFDCRQPLFYADIRWDSLMEMASRHRIEFRELPRQLPVYRDLAMIVRESLPYERVKDAIRGARLDKLREVRLFDIFESEKLGAGKRSLALSLTFLDEEKTLTDKEIDGMVARIMTALEREIGAEIRK